jgi:tetratricopeptide (TPR) repeat protein
MEYVTWFWNDILDIPLTKVAEMFGFEVFGTWLGVMFKVGFIIAGIFAVFEVYFQIGKLVRKFYADKDNDDLSPEEEMKLAKEPQFNNDVKAVRGAANSITVLKAQKDWVRLAETYASLNKFNEAAKYFKKGGDNKRAALQMAKAGKILPAAKLLQKAGEHALAARFFAEKGKHLLAAKAFTAANDLASAGAAFRDAKKYPEAAKAFLEYFSNSRTGGADEARAAELCTQFLEDSAARAAADEGDLKRMARGIAERFDAAQRNDLAAKYYMQAGEMEKAGNVFLRVGRLEEAAKCMQAAGKTREAAEIGGRFYESKGLWKEAGMAYEGAGEYRRAGDCFSKANDAVRAGSAFEKAGEFFGAGFALVHAKKWAEAIPMFQRVREDNKAYPESRLLLGRCFYHLKDHQHCAATLENHLTGEKVTSKNIDYFWMLALAYEQIGELEKSKNILQKIRTVDMGFRDVSARLSNIESRISLIPKMGTQAPIMNTPLPNDATAVMTMVASAVGSRYKLERELGRGGMGVVYMGRDEQLDRPVALKFLGSLVDGSPEYKERFLREAKTAAKINHPNVIAIYDVSMQEGNTFIAMEYIEGPNLHKYMQSKGRLEPREAVNYIGQAASALSAIHEAGIVHRDIKPENILVAKGGLIKVMDFGLAKMDDYRLTAANVVMGTPCYMSPEQVRGGEVDARSDIYAMGLVLYELLTGKTVFIDGDVMQRQLVEMPPPPGELVEGIPPMLDQVIMKCIAKKPEERFQTAKELVAFLRQVNK